MVDAIERTEISRRTPVKYVKARVTPRGKIANNARFLKSEPMIVDVGEQYFVVDYNANDAKDVGLGHFIEVSHDPEHPLVDISRLRKVAVGDLSKERSIGGLLKTLYVQYINTHKLADAMDEAVTILGKYDDQNADVLVARASYNYVLDIQLLKAFGLPAGISNFEILITDFDGNIKTIVDSIEEPLAVWNGLDDLAILRTTFADGSIVTWAIFPEYRENSSVGLLLIRTDAQRLDRLYVDGHGNLHAVDLATYIRNFLQFDLNVALAKYYITYDRPAFYTVNNKRKPDYFGNGNAEGYYFMMSLLDRTTIQDITQFLKDIDAIVNGVQDGEQEFIEAQVLSSS